MSLSIAMIQEEVAAYFGLAPIEMRSQRRGRQVARPRQIAMFLCRDFTSHSLPVIGRHFGDRDHTTVLHAIRHVKSLCESSPLVAHDVDALRCRLWFADDFEEFWTVGEGSLHAE